MEHYYIERSTGTPVREKFFSDDLIKFIYDPVRENFSFLFNLLTGSFSSKAAAFFNYDFPLGNEKKRVENLIREMEIDKTEFFLKKNDLLTPRKVFERKIKYWESRPMDKDLSIIVSPSDSRIVTGENSGSSLFPIKNKFFSYTELLSKNSKWSDLFKKGIFAIFRLTPDKYHYNHSPVSGKVVDIYQLDGKYHSCNPYIFSKINKPLCKNKRIVTIIDTDTENGSNIGLVAMVEVAALMIGEIIQCYSSEKYESPVHISKGQFLEKGSPKSRFAPGSSTIVLLFQENKINFDSDLIKNRDRKSIQSRLSNDFKTPLIETDLKVRESIATRI